MNKSEERYVGERRRVDLAVRMISHEARTGTIRGCTGLSEDRIRKLYAHYFRDSADPVVRRRRGKTPRQPTYFLTTPARQMEATTLAGLFLAAGLLNVVAHGRLGFANDHGSTRFGLRFCEIYESYLALHDPAAISFERAWNLLDALARNHELGIARCDRCASVHVHDLLAVGRPVCPCCRLKDTNKGGGR